MSTVMFFVFPTMLCVVAAICTVMLCILLHGVDGGLHVVGLFQHVGHDLVHVVLVHLLGGALHADQERNRRVLDRRALAAG